MIMEDVEKAIWRRVEQASGLTAIWTNQTRKRPARPFVELALIKSVADEWAEENVEDNPDSTGSDGEELLQNTLEHVILTVQVRVYSSAVVGNARAFNVAQTIRTKFGTTAYTEALWGDGVAVVDRGAVQDLTLVLESEHEGRAVFDMRFRVADLTTETTTFIETTEVETTVEQTSGDVVRTITVTRT